jgi:hypothetical protein
MLAAQPAPDGGDRQFPHRRGAAKAARLLRGINYMAENLSGRLSGRGAGGRLCLSPVGADRRGNPVCIRRDPEEEQFRYLGAFKYDSELSSGTNTHADNANVNVNFYITADDANLDPDSGGLKFGMRARPDLQTMRKLNGSEEMVGAFLKRMGAKPSIVPHRANRAVIFGSTCNSTRRIGSGSGTTTRQAADQHFHSVRPVR